MRILHSYSYLNEKISNLNSQISELQLQYDNLTDPNSKEAQLIESAIADLESELDELLDERNEMVGC